ncbi:MAG: aspartate aminotransferase family protein [Gammaproteobacteria bacterium]
MNAQPTSLVDTLIALKQRYLMPCVMHFYRRPMALVRGEGAEVFDADGKVYLDCYAGVGVTNCGHAEPSILARVTAQLRQLVHTTTIYLTEPMMRLAESLAEFLGGRLSRSFFCTSGSEANETALLLAKLATGRNDFIALSRSLHGRTYLTSGVTGMAFWRADPSPPDNVHFAPSPLCSDCPLQLQRATCGLRCADEVARIAEAHPGRVAAFIAEPIAGNGGIVTPPPGYFERVQEILRRHGILFIVDEAQTGFCRTGHRFGHQHWDVQPDMVTVCKALGNGFPIAAIVATPEVAAHYTKPGASTFGGNPVCASAALAVLDFMRSRQLERRAARAGVRLRRGLGALAERYAGIREIRGLGLMLGVELVDDDGAPAGARLDALLEDLKDHGVLAGKTGPGRNVLTFMPPLVITDAQIDALLDTLDTAMSRHFTRCAAATA